MSCREEPRRSRRELASAGAWEALERAFDWSAVRSLPDRIGLPDAADTGGEFLEVSIGGDTKRVDFPRGATIPEVAALLDALRDLRTATMAFDEHNQTSLIHSPDPQVEPGWKQFGWGHSATFAGVGETTDAAGCAGPRPIRRGSSSS